MLGPSKDEAYPGARTVQSTTRSLPAYYFAVFAGLGAVLPFLPLVLAERGLGAREIGWVLLLGPIGNLVAPPAWGWLADSLGIRKQLLAVAAAGSAGGVLMLVPDVGLAAAVSAMAVYSFCRAPIVPMADAAAHAELGDDAPRFARVRVWGSIGFAMVAATLGALHASHRPVLLFGVAAGAYACAAAVGARLHAPVQPRQRRVLIRALARVREQRLGALLAGCVLYYLAHGSYDAFIGLHLEALGHGDGLVGAAWATGVGIEIALMLVVAPIIRRFHGATLMVVGGVASVLRWTLLSWVVSAAGVLAVQSLHALTFGLWYLAMVGYVQVRATDALRTSVQALVHAAMALGMVGGYLLGGEVFERAGGAALFRLAAVAAAGATLLYAANALRDRAHR